ncbi:hypothetical protein PCANB_000700 [Pneumocystis canis]|nr:hypothetical protein PCANB_000700 [Pneumocystis canis]
MEPLETPYESLKQLSNILARQPTKSNFIKKQKTSISERKTPYKEKQGNSRINLTPYSNTQPRTPYTIHAQQKAITPRRDIKKITQKILNDTPRTILKKLSRELPHYQKENKIDLKSHTISSELNAYDLNHLNDLDNLDDLEELIEAPEISLPNLEISSDDISPPNPFIALDQEYTVQSVEMGRKADLKRLSDRLSPEKDTDHISIYHERGMNNTSFDEFALQDDEFLKSENLFKDNLKLGFNENDLIEDDPSHLEMTLINEKSPEMIKSVSFKNTYPEFSLPDFTKPATKLVSKTSVHSKKSKILKLSRYGVSFPSLPTAFIKQLVANFTTSKISKDALKEIVSVSDQFFEQVSEDLETFAAHAGRKTIEDSDVIQLMKR